MKREKTILISIVLALCLFPGLAAAEETVQAAVPAPAQGCDDLGFLAQAPVSSATPALALDPLAGVVEVQVGRGCCFGKRVACQAVCVCGVFEFNCDPATCQSNCICKICP